MTKRTISPETRAKLSAAGKKRAQAFTSEYQKSTRSQLPKEVCVAGGKTAYQLQVKKYGKEFAQDKAAQWRLANPSSLELKVIEWLSYANMPYHKREEKITFEDGFYCYVDFLFPNSKIVIEVNGQWVHEQRIDRDVAKIDHLSAAGYTVIVIPECDVKSGKAQEIIEKLFGERY